MEATEILGFGIVAVDDTFVVDGYPAPDTKQRILSTRRSGGGQTATALVAAARLGCACRWRGNLGDNELSRFLRTVFEREGVRFDTATPHPGSSPIHSIIINDKRNGSRTIIWNEDAVFPLEPTESELTLVRSAKCLFADQGSPATQIAAARRAAELDIPIVSDIERFDTEHVRELAGLADHFIFPASMAGSVFGESDPGRAVAKALRLGRKHLVCLTDGERGAWFATADNPGKVMFQAAFPVTPVVDTNGCGDVFHGAYAAGLVKGFPVVERIRRAAAAAALKVRSYGGQEGAPTLKELEAFLGGTA